MLAGALNPLPSFSRTRGKTQYGTMAHKQLLKIQNSVQSVLSLGPKVGGIRKDTCPRMDANEDALGGLGKMSPVGEEGRWGWCGVEVLTVLES